jgi:hypothetical protein
MLASPRSAVARSWKKARARPSGKGDPHPGHEVHLYSQLRKRSLTRALVPLDDRLPPLRLALFWQRHRLLAPAAEELGEQARAVCATFYQDDQTLV